MMYRRDRRDLAKQLLQAISQIQELKTENKILLAKLHTDEFTDVANRRVFEEWLPVLVATAHKSNEPLGLLIADVDGLKRTNDSMGHDQGDVLLKAVAQALKKASRESDIPGRFGGDEFFVLLPGFYPLPGQDRDELVAKTIERYRNCFNEYIRELNLPKELGVNVSFGLALLQNGETADEFYRRADQIYQANKKMAYYNLRKKGVDLRDERLGI